MTMANRQSWYAVHCKPFRESQAASALESRLCLPVYLPEIRRRFHGRTQQVALFPGYLFVRANLQVDRLSSINATPGVLRLVAFDGIPQPLPDGALEAVRELVNHFNLQSVQPEYSFRAGDAVQLKGGPLEGLKAIFAGPVEPSERVRILINFLGGCREAEVNVRLLQPVGSELIAVPERRTRGHGRKIRPS
jgi:transcriptional antiterminator RfaH